MVKFEPSFNEFVTLIFNNNEERFSFLSKYKNEWLWYKCWESDL